MGYQVIWEKRADRALSGLERRAIDRILDLVDALQDEPRPRGAEKLQGKLQGHYRVRAGRSYRVVYRIDDAERQVTVVNVGSREGIY